MKLKIVACAALTLAACATVSTTPTMTGEPYGAPITLKTVTPVSKILAQPAQYVGKDVLIEGEVVAVCEKKGCWMDLKTDADGVMQVKVEDDVIIFPVSARGRKALVQGVVEEMKQTPEQVKAAAAHRAEEQGEKFDSTQVFKPATTYRIMGKGALIRD